MPVGAEFVQIFRTINTLSWYKILKSSNKDKQFYQLNHSTTTDPNSAGTAYIELRRLLHIGHLLVPMHLIEYWKTRLVTDTQHTTYQDQIIGYIYP